MDPTACLSRLIDAFDANDMDEAREAAADLRNWIDRGGFAADVSKFTPAQINRILRLATYGAEYAADCWGQIEA